MERLKPSGEPKGSLHHSKEIQSLGWSMGGWGVKGRKALGPHLERIVEMKLGNLSKLMERKSDRGDGLAVRTKTYKEVYAATRDRRAATRAYCSGNRWLTENAKATGNW